jgi:hypothetical protein
MQLQHEQSKSKLATQSQKTPAGSAVWGKHTPSGSWIAPARVDWWQYVGAVLVMCTERMTGLLSIVQSVLQHHHVAKK